MEFLHPINKFIMQFICTPSISPYHQPRTLFTVRYNSCGVCSTNRVVVKSVVAILIAYEIYLSNAN